MPWLAALESDPRLQGVICFALASGILLIEGLGYWAFHKPRKLEIVVRRRSVPWSFGDLVLIAAVFYISFAVWALLWRSFVPAPANTIPSPGIESQTSLHPLFRLMQHKQWNYVLVCGISAVLVAPLVEEYFFRVFLQGWLEGLERRGRRRWRILRRRFLRGVFPVLLSALSFALLHIRKSGPEHEEEFLLFKISGNAAVSLLALSFALFWMHFVRGATAADLGWAPKFFYRDLWWGLCVFFVFIVPLYLIQAGASLLLPEGITPDPLPLFLLAVVLGALYYSKHRVVSLLAAHMAINAFAFFVALWYLF